MRKKKSGHDFVKIEKGKLVNLISLREPFDQSNWYTLLGRESLDHIGQIFDVYNICYGRKRYVRLLVDFYEKTSSLKLICSFVLIQFVHQSPLKAERCLKILKIVLNKLYAKQNN